MLFTPVVSLTVTGVAFSGGVEDMQIHAPLAYLEYAISASLFRHITLYEEATVLPPPNPSLSSELMGPRLRGAIHMV